MMNNSLLKRIDQIGISLLTLLLILSFVFRVSPVSIMNPGFPILTHWSSRGTRSTDVYDSNKVAYGTLYLVADHSQSDTSFSIMHNVTRFSSSAEAMNMWQSSYEAYLQEHRPHPDYQLSYKFVTDIPGLHFAAKADKYHLWCEQLSPIKDPAYIPPYEGEKVDTCYYWAVYGRFYSALRVAMWPTVGGGRHFSVDILNDTLNRADRKLSSAQWWFK